MSKKPTVLMILDGYGLSDKTEGNAVKQAKTPVMDKLIAKYPFVQGEASGMAVGLPDGQMGNSEVGHTNMGAGRIVYQMLVKISKSIQDGDFFENKALVAAMENCKKNDSALHLMGLLSPGGVHSHMEHLYGLLEMAKKNGLEKVYVHAYLDGRDVPPSSAAEYMEELVAKIKEIGVGSVATISGRFYAMDRDNAWEREEKAYSALVYGEGVQADDPVQAIKDSYANDVTDEFMLPTVVDKNGMIHENDSVIFFNFRPDRARQLTRALVGHTGIMEAAIKAIEVVDECVGKTVDAILDVDGQMFICADHGNAEKLLDEDGEPFTAHTTNPVPFVLVNYDEDYTLREGGCLADIVPTMIEMMGMEQPAEMTGKSLLIKK